MSESYNTEQNVAIDRRQHTEWSALVKGLIDDGWLADDAAVEANKHLRRKS